MACSGGESVEPETSQPVSHSADRSDRKALKKSQIKAIAEGLNPRGMR